MMSAKHTPSTDALETLGNVISPLEKRDAIHLAVDPAFSKNYLNPGDHVRIIAPGEVVRCGVGQGHGIVDPFLRRSVDPGEYFWLVVYPREITSLRHVWSHPAFTDEPQREPHVAYPMPNLAASDPVPKPFKVPTPEPDAASLMAQLASATMMTSMVAPVVSDADRRAREESRAWIYNFAMGLGLDYLVKGGDLEGEYVPDEFWDHYQVVKEEKVDENDRGSFFSCSC